MCSLLSDITLELRSVNEKNDLSLLQKVIATERAQSKGTKKESYLKQNSFQVETNKSLNRIGVFK